MKPESKEITTLDEQIAAMDDQLEAMALIEKYQARIAKLEEREKTWIDEIKRIQDKDIELEKQLARSEALNSTYFLHLNKFVQQEEVNIDQYHADGRIRPMFPSPERAKDYIESSTFLRDNFGRKDYGNIDDAQRWYDSQGIDWSVIKKS